MYPVLSVVAAIQSENSKTELLYLGRHGSIEERLAERAHIPFQSIQVGGVRGLSPWKAIRNLFQVVASISTVRSIIRQWKPDTIFVTGGYVSAPVVWAGSAEHIPSVIYLPDLEPGWSVRATAYWATQVAISFPEVARYLPKNKSVVTGYPVRSEFAHVDRIKARQGFRLDPNARTITILGGSLGAHAINQAVVANLDRLASLTQIIHITGKEDETGVREQVMRIAPEFQDRVRVYGYLDREMAEALAAADIVIARAGAATLGEFPALGLPAVLVPYPYSGKHQDKNAEFLASRGAAVQVDNDSLAKELVPTLRRLLDDPEQLNRMTLASRAMAVPDAANRIAHLLQSYAGECA